MHQLAMACLLLACLSGAWLNMTVGMSLLVTSIFVLGVVQVHFKTQFLSLEFHEKVGLEMEVAEQLSVSGIIRAWREPLQPRNLRRVTSAWSEVADHRHAEEARWGQGRSPSDTPYSPLHASSRPDDEAPPPTRQGGHGVVRLVETPPPAAARFAPVDSDAQQERPQAAEPQPRPEPQVISRLATAASGRRPSPTGSRGEGRAVSRVTQSERDHPPGSVKLDA